MEISCKECAQRKTCTTLCPAAKKYTNQDWVKQDTGHLLYEHRMTQSHRNKLTFLEWAESHGNKLSWPDMLRDSQLGSAEWEIIDKKVQLTPKQRDFLYLNFWEGYSLRKIARLKQTSVQNVHQSIAGALKKVEHALIFSNILEAQNLIGEKNENYNHNQSQNR